MKKSVTALLVGLFALFGWCIPELKKMAQERQDSEYSG